MNAGKVRALLVIYTLAAFRGFVLKAMHEDKNKLTLRATQVASCVDAWIACFEALSSAALLYFAPDHRPGRPVSTTARMSAPSHRRMTSKPPRTAAISGLVGRPSGSGWHGTPKSPRGSPGRGTVVGSRSWPSLPARKAAAVTLDPCVCDARCVCQVETRWNWAAKNYILEQGRLGMADVAEAMAMAATATVHDH